MARVRFEVDWVPHPIVNEDLFEAAQVPTDELEQAATAYEEQVSEAVASDEETAAYVEELENRADTLEEQGDLPSGDALAAELTRFLREREQDNGESGPRGPAA